MSENPIYTMQDLVCGYPGVGDVLKIPSLQIHAGRTYIILGKSGSGKSTFLETLALMNNTINSGQISFQPYSATEKPSYDYRELWQNYSPGSLSKIRCNHFSFIFQQTNLMPNFTVYENIYLTRLMQGYPESECEAKTKVILDRMDMSFIDRNRKVTELSGGQKQRVAFARAIISSFGVLFGDEPTGNLDEVNSVELLRLLKENIEAETNIRHRTAIIVSHSIPLALKFADNILVIVKKNENSPGEILQENCFERITTENGSYWRNTQQNFPEAGFENKLMNLFSQ